MLIFAPLILVSLFESIYLCELYAAIWCVKRVCCEESHPHIYNSQQQKNHLNTQQIVDFIRFRTKLLTYLFCISLETVHPVCAQRSSFIFEQFIIYFFVFYSTNFFFFLILIKVCVFPPLCLCVYVCGACGGQNECQTDTQANTGSRSCHFCAVLCWIGTTVFNSPFKFAEKYFSHRSKW